MPKDQRLYGKFTLDFPDSCKILPLSDAAFRCLVEATLWSRKQMTDGFLATRLAVAKWGLEVLQELCGNDPDNPSLIAVENGYQIHDFADHQDTKAEIEARSERNKLNGQKGGMAKGKRVAKPVASQSVSENLAETETETETTEPTYVGSGPRKRGCRLPNDWMPDKSVINEMRVERPGVDLQAEHRKFVDYWKAKTGQGATKLDWDATFRNWIRNARTAEDGRAPHKLRALAELAQEVRAEEQTTMKELA